jgi:bifunctional non-homologous end joining protein LigD
LELAARDEAGGLGDAPWPPHFRKMPGESARVAPSRAKAAKGASESRKQPRARRVKMPLLVVANSPDKDAALAGLERWKARHPEVVARLAPEDVIVDTNRGRATAWYRVRINLKNVPEAERPPPAPPDPDYDPKTEYATEEIAAWHAARAGSSGEPTAGDSGATAGDGAGDGDAEDR